MYQLDLQEAKTCLPELIEAVASGEEVIITRQDGAVFKIVPFNAKDIRPKFGSAKGLVKISDDFEQPLEDFEAYAP
jgi:antitoxin (DNA-binding transcriptional repressor) of toxin-antitoxin stability system